jgi:subfamily B ATP-binding cassette protein MsbA
VRIFQRMQESFVVSDTPTFAMVRRVVKGYMRPYRKHVMLAVVCMVLVACAAAGNAWLLQPVLDDIFVNKKQELLAWIPLAIVGMALVGASANYGQTVLMRAVGQGMIAKMQVDLFQHLLHADVGVYHDQSSGRLITRFTSDIQMMRNAVSSLLTGIAKEALTMIFLVGVMVHQSWQLSLLALGVYPIAFYPIVRLGKRMRKVTDKAQQELGGFAALLDDAFSAVRVVKAYGREDFEVERASQSVGRLFKLYTKASRIQAIASPMMEVLGSVAVAGVIFYGGMQVIDGTTTAGKFFSFVTAMLMAYKPARAMAGMSGQLQEGLAAARRFFAVMDQPATIQDKPDAMPLVTKAQGAQISFEHVSFEYADGTTALHDVHFDVPAGKMAALVGASGAGKTTVMQMLLRFYDVAQGNGCITIDEQDIRDVTQASLREHIAFVSQDIMLFDGTIYENIAYGLEGATAQQVHEAAIAADAHGFILEQPHGYDTRIGPSGMRLSGGQRQRISIARAMLRNAPILLLDEATSALDTTSERSVQKALDALMQHRTTLVIAHRLSTVRHADIIFVMDKGTIVESGTHQELLEAKGAYAQLHTAQFHGDVA